MKPFADRLEELLLREAQKRQKQQQEQPEQRGAEAEAAGRGKASDGGGRASGSQQQQATNQPAAFDVLPTLQVGGKGRGGVRESGLLLRQETLTHRGCLG